MRSETHNIKKVACLFLKPAIDSVVGKMERSGDVCLDESGTDGVKYSNGETGDESCNGRDGDPGVVRKPVDKPSCFLLFLITNSEDRS